MKVTIEAKSLRPILQGLQTHVCTDGTRSFDSLVEVRRTGTMVTFETTDGFRAFHRAVEEHGVTEGDDGKGYLHLREVKSALVLMPKAGPYTLEVHDTGATWPDLSRVADLSKQGYTFNTKYLRDALNALKDSEYVSLELHEDHASIIRPATGAGIQSETDYILVMPVYISPSERAARKVKETADVS